MRDSSHSYKREQFIFLLFYFSQMDNSRAKFSLTDTCRYFSFRQVSHIFFFCLKNRGFFFLFCRIIKDFIYSYATTSSSCSIHASFYFIIIFSLFFSSHLILLFLSNWNSNSWRLSFIIWIFFFTSSSIVPIYVCTTLCSINTFMPCLLLNFARANMSSMTNLISSSTTSLKIKIVKMKIGLNNLHKRCCCLLIIHIEREGEWVREEMMENISWRLMTKTH